MKFSTREDIDAPIDAVFDMLCEFESFERSAMRRGAEVRRLDELKLPGTGMSWEALFPFRGKTRHMRINLITFDRPNEMVFETVSPGMSGTMTLELMALSRTRTRIMIAFNVVPHNLSARLLIQSLKLAKSSLTKRYKLRVAEYAKTLEERYQRLA